MNKAKVVDKIKATGRTVNGWARYRGHKTTTVHAILAGRIPPHAYSYKAVAADLRADGYMDADDE